MSIVSEGRQSKPLPVASSHELPKHYVRVPVRLLEQAAYDGRLAGLYALIARLYLARKTPVPLSSSDVVRFDPSLSRGAAQRLLARLSATGWLIETATAGNKSVYVPSWGLIHGSPLIWSLDAACLGRPRHVRAIALDLQLLDILMGKLTPHAARGAIVTRYVTAPVIALVDVGAYALALAGLPAVSSQLQAWGMLIGHLPQPLPETTTLLARISQASLFGETRATLSASGARVLGVTADERSAGGQTLFFVPPELIGNRSGPWIVPLIAPTDVHAKDLSRVGRHEMPCSLDPHGITWDTKESLETHDPPTRAGGIQPSSTLKSPESRATSGKSNRTASPLVIPETPSVACLRALNVRPKALVRHAETPLSQIEAALADVRMRPYVKDEAAWVIALLDDAQQHGWKLPVPTFAPIISAVDELQSAKDSRENETKVTGISAAVAEQEVIDDLDLTAHVHAELRWRVPDRTARTVSSTLVVQETPSTIVVICAKPEHVHIVNTHLLLPLQSVLAACGRTQLLRIVVAGRVAPAHIRESMACPIWIEGDVWNTLSPLLRATLTGSTLKSHGVEAASPTLQAMVYRRYAAEVAALVARANSG